MRKYNRHNPSPRPPPRCRAGVKEKRSFSFPNSCLGMVFFETLFRPGVRGVGAQPETEFQKTSFPNRSLGTREARSSPAPLRGGGRGEGLYRILLGSALLVLLLPSPALAYIGPGAGVALAGSFVAVLVAFLSAFFLLLTWPV